MNLDNKKVLITNLKIKLELLIEESLIQIPINMNTIKNSLDEHYDFINFIESMNIYEDYKWEKIKEEYNKIKKKVNINKKLYPEIIKIYGIVNNYYSIDEFNNKNSIIKKLNEDNILLKIEYEKIKKLHNIFIIKRKNYVKNMKITKIYITDKDSEQLIERLYQIHNDLKILKKEIKILKSNRVIE
jgi:hypothetical protein